MRKVHFCQKWYSESSQNCSYLYRSWSLIGTVFDSKISLASNSIGYTFKTSLSSHSFATKKLRVSQVTPITLQNNLKVKIWFQTFQNTSSFWELLEPSKKALFLKCQQATSNPNVEWYKLPMTKLWICFEL